MRKLQYVFMTLAVLCFAVPAFARMAARPPVNLVPIGAGIGMALAAGLCGLGQGTATASAAEALARNPGARAGIQLLPGARPGLHRVPHPVHPGHHLRQGQVGTVLKNEAASPGWVGPLCFMDGFENTMERIA